MIAVYLILCFMVLFEGLLLRLLEQLEKLEIQKTEKHESKVTLGSRIKIRYYLGIFPKSGIKDTTQKMIF